MIASTLLDPEEVARREAFVGRMVQSFTQAEEMLTVYLGDRLGLYQALLEIGPATSTELAAQTDSHERYIREWLEQQAVAGIVEVDGPQAAASARRYHLPLGHAEVLLAHESLNYMVPLAAALPALISPLSTLMQAFRGGGGVPPTAYGFNAHEVHAALTRSVYLNLLGSTWLPAIADVHARLEADSPAHVADIACGAGWSSIAVARAYPKVRVEGFDLDEAAISLARQHAAEEGVTERVSFHVQEATRAIQSGPYEVVLICNALHELARPVEALRVVRDVLAADGVVIIVDGRSPQSFTAPGEPLDRQAYAQSVLYCLPVGMAEQPSAASGNIMRPTTVRRYAREAGFHEVEILPIDHVLFRFYRVMA